jgi:hypothetical protein
MVTLEVEPRTTQSSSIFARVVTWGKTTLSSIQSGGQINWGNIITMVALAALVYIGNLIRIDHEQVLTQPIQTQGQLTLIQSTVSSINTQVATITAELPSLIERQNELEARVDCLQAVASTEFCEKRRRK